ncbi:MAG: heme-binding protein [Burkholderiaceae bacterium]|nr:heme-binding protein [Burkholderiaceae bacterium]
MASNLSLQQARAIVDAMLDAAAERKLRFTAAVVDTGGELVCVSRMDGASANTARMSVNKAYTAVKWLQDTKALKARLFDPALGDDRRDITWFGDPRYTPIWGGILLRTSDGTVVGALGGSGGTPEQDEEIGRIGARLFSSQA